MYTFQGGMLIFGVQLICLQTNWIRSPFRSSSRSFGKSLDLNALNPARRLPKSSLITRADKAYDADKLRNWLKQQCVDAVIPSSAARRTPYPIDNVAYRRRKTIERLFGHLKNWRSIATRYDGQASNYLAAPALVSIVIARCEMNP